MQNQNNEVLKNIETVKQGIEAFIRAITAKPETFTINILKGEKDVVFEIIGTDRIEVGKIIGVNGRNRRALQRLVRSAGRKVGKKFFIEIVNKNE